ncbi:hypothetical protein EVAR_9605_1 [Eumeta japonica]|uniref:Uncharacterized protein n=1 Tax=Eumeta variegata TaxID=151549 RepID=A0A4C1TJI2_EUMVA|nr:hypothetical protein EVAR_9605_1 [Eumeta japonica]
MLFRTSWTSVYPPLIGYQCARNRVRSVSFEFAVKISITTHTFDRNYERWKGSPTDNALVGCYVLRKTLGLSADLKAKIKHTVFNTSAADPADLERTGEAQPRLI